MNHQKRFAMGFQIVSILMFLSFMIMIIYLAGKVMFLVMGVLLGLVGASYVVGYIYELITNPKKPK